MTKKENKTIEFQLIDGRRKRFIIENIERIAPQYNMFSGGIDAVLFYRGGNSYVLKASFENCLKKLKGE